MNETDLEDGLNCLLNHARYDEDIDFESLVSVRTFSEAFLLTRDRGLVLRFKDGSEFQLTIIQSKRGNATQEDNDESA